MVFWSMVHRIVKRIVRFHCGLRKYKRYQAPFATVKGGFIMNIAERRQFSNMFVVGSVRRKLAQGHQFFSCHCDVLRIPLDDPAEKEGAMQADMPGGEPLIFLKQRINPLYKDRN